MRKYITSIVAMITLLSITLSDAQNASDVLRYSAQEQQGTARAIGIGGAIGGLGGDFSSLSINPAGIGGYWRSEVMVSPSFTINNTKSSLNGGIESQELARKFGLGNVGLVFTNTSDRGAWKAVSLGLGLNKQNAYHQKSFYSNETSGSIVNRFSALANGLDPSELDNFEAGPAYDAYAIDDADNDGFYESDFDGEDQEVFKKSQIIETSGYNNEFVISLGGNLKNKVLMGATIGIPFVSYKSEKGYQELDGSDVIPAFTQLQYNEYLTTEGSGLNIKLGAILKVNKSLRLGAAFHSPTYMTLTDRFNTELTYQFDDGPGPESWDGNSPDGEFEYILSTPWKAVANAAWIIGKKGFISTDIEYVDYSSARYDFSTNSDNLEDRAYQDIVNAQIKDLYKGAVNIRLGGELAMEGLRFRAGGQLLGSPFAGDTAMKTVLSLGAGIRGDKAFLDLGFRHSTGTETYLPYQIEGAPTQVVENKLGNNLFVATVGFKI